MNLSATEFHSSFFSSPFCTLFSPVVHKRLICFNYVNISYLSKCFNVCWLCPFPWLLKGWFDISSGSIIQETDRNAESLELHNTCCLRLHTFGNFLVNSHLRSLESCTTLGIGKGCALEELRPRLKTCYAKLLSLWPLENYFASLTLNILNYYGNHKVIQALLQQILKSPYSY